MRKVWRDPRWASEEAAALVEYILLVALIALAAIVGMGNLGSATGDGMSVTAQAIEDSTKHGHGHGPGGLPPGHGGTPPGHGGTPPGQGGGKK